MGPIWVILAVFLVVVAAAAIVVGGLTLFSRFRAGEPVRIPLRDLLRVYLYIVIIVGMLLFTQGVSGLIRAGLGAALDKDYSYRPVFFGFKPEPRAPDPLELKDRTQLTDADREKLAGILGEREQVDIERQREQREEGLDRALKEGLIERVTFAIVGAIIWGVHMGGRKGLETAEERDSALNKVYLILIVVIFGIITIVNLPQAIAESFRFYLLDPLDEFSRQSPPGGKLALSIASLPVWIAYLVTAVRAVTRGS